jgi:sortase A
MTWATTSRRRLVALALTIVALLATNVALLSTRDRAAATAPPALAVPSGLGDMAAAGVAGVLARVPAPVPAAAPEPEAAALPQPAAVPSDDATEPLVVLGSIEIPRLGLATTLYQGIALSTIDQGPSHWPGTALPGQLGNVVVAGHRVTHSRPFRHLDRMQPGDRVIFTVGDQRTEYEMVANEVVAPDGMHIVEQRAEHTATLFACHPPGSARYRFVVHLRMVR